MDEAQLYAMMRPRNVCICRAVSEKRIRETISSGQASNFEELQQLTRCSTGCGTCESKVRRIMNDELEQLSLRNQPSS
ncbi:MAG: ferredoxin [Leptospiraceae bacterium]|nr:ferredoxin [Leptospiraceae bacterium]